MWKRKAVVLNDLAFLFASRKGNGFEAAESGRIFILPDFNR